MAEMVSYGANFVKMYDDENDVYLTFKCREEVILDDRVIEEAKRLIYGLIEDYELHNLYELYSKGWYLQGVEA